MKGRPSNHSRIRLGADAATGQSTYLDLDRLATHLHLIGSTGSGKTRLLLWLFQRLSRLPHACLVLVNPKADLAVMARNWTIAHGLTKRLVWFAPADPEVVVGFNPLYPNALPPMRHAKSVREAIVSAWGQASLDQTPQLARLLLLSLAVSRVTNRSLMDAVKLLRSGPAGATVRQMLLPAVGNIQYLQDALAWYDALKERRQEELSASTLARLEAFVCDPTICRVLTAPCTLELEHVIANKQILIVDLPIGPLAKDDVKLIGRLLLNSVLNCAFARPKQQRLPIYLIIDECQNFVTQDVANVLDMGRELGLHLILAHQRLEQLRQEDASGQVYDAVMSCARTKLVFGGLPVHDLEVLAPELTIDQYDPWAVKDELTRLELDPLETTRQVQTQGTSDSVASGNSQGTSWSITKSQTKGASFQTGLSRTIASSTSSGQALGVQPYVLPTGETGEHILTSSFSGASHIEAATDHEALGHHYSQSQGSATGGHSSRSVTQTRTVSRSVSQVPFYEYRKRHVVASRTFLTKEECNTLAVKTLKALPRGHFMVKTHGHKAIILRAPYVADPWISRQRLSAAQDRLASQPHYLKLHNKEPETPMVVNTGLGKDKVLQSDYQPPDCSVESAQEDFE